MRKQLIFRVVLQSISSTTGLAKVSFRWVFRTTISCTAAERSESPYVEIPCQLRRDQGPGKLKKGEREGEGRKYEEEWDEEEEEQERGVSRSGRKGSPKRLFSTGFRVQPRERPISTALLHSRPLKMSEYKGWKPPSGHDDWILFAGALARQPYGRPPTRTPYGYIVGVEDPGRGFRYETVTVSIPLHDTVTVSHATGYTERNLDVNE